MAKEREANSNLAEFVKITKLGQSVAGQVRSFGKNSNGPFAVLEPVLLRDNPAGRWQRYGSVALGLSADIERKVDEKKDVGKMLQFTFDREEPTKFGNNKKIFVVVELELSEIRALAAEADDMTGQPLPKPAGRGDVSSGTMQPLF